ncbi:SDR family NAD(P)-dependent oxidoreductase [Mycolicibacterium gilvum]|uniref:Short-chain dehydrogenase n=1 Tax=Mycolicibacterium gilvum TaxID=1804 RepID=A0A378SE56_9MYCO|nr:SDR family oxidoreductase [Mycolicibacterium gilvum]MCV7057772.1 SDR family oxidoreductase [Mycolicibacterium gilvum]STZ41112.1 short-chain dehydrogenase [Mycolicibacterium gilvum]
MGERLALVAGGSGGIGSAICQALARDGFDVALTYRHNVEAAERTAEAVRELGATAWAHQVDLTDIEATAALVRALPRLDTVIYAAGPSIPMRYTAQITPQEFAHQLAADAAACFNLLQPAIERLRVSRGSMVALVTTALLRYATRDLLSAAPKGAVEQLVRAIAAEEGKNGVRANCVGVGVIATGVLDDLIDSGDYHQEALEAARRAIPMRRFGSAEELADVVAFLAGTRSAYVTGQTLRVDGGYSV